MTPEEARARAQAEAEAEFEFGDSSADIGGLNLQTKPPGTFGSEFAGGQESFLGNVGQWAGDIGNAALGMITGPADLLAKSAMKFGQDPTARMMPMGLGAIKSMGETMYEGVEDVSGAFQRTGEIASSFIPGGRTAYNWGIDKVTGQEKTGAEYGKQFRQDLAAGPALLAPVGVAKTLARGDAMLAKAATVREMKAAAMTDPTSQAALRFAENRGLLNTPSAQRDLTAGRLTPELQEAAGAAQREAVLTKTAGVDSGKDYLPGTALGYPENNSMRSAAASETMAEAGPTIINSNVLQGGERINPFTGKFEGPPSAPTDSYALANRMELASADIIQARKMTVAALDEAQQTINKQSPGEPKIRGIMFDADMAVTSEAMSELSNVIQKRRQLIQSEPMAQGMQQAWNQVEASFEAVNNSTGYDRWRKIGPGGSFQKGELSPSQMLDMIENMNAVRKSLGEFDEMAKANGLNSTHNDFAGRASELYALGKIQTAAQAALEAKAGEILSLAPSAKGYYLWQERLAPVTADTLATMNRTYGAFQTAKEAAQTYGNTTGRGLVTPEPGRLLTTQKDASAADLINNPKKTLIQKGLDAVGLGGRDPNLPLQASQRNTIRPNAAISQMLDGLLLRQKAVPILSRDWEKVRIDPTQIAEVGNRAVMMGLVAQGQFENLSDPLKHQVFQMVATTLPDGMEAAPQGLNLLDGQYMNPMEKDAIVMQNLDKSPEERYKFIGSSFENKYPVDEPVISVKKPVPAQAPMDIESVNQALDFGLAQGPAARATPETEDMIAKFEKMTAIHGQDYIQ